MVMHTVSKFNTNPNDTNQYQITDVSLGQALLGKLRRQRPRTATSKVKLRRRVLTRPDIHFIRETGLQTRHLGMAQPQNV